MTALAPLTFTFEATVGAAAAGDDASTVVGVAPFAGTVTAVEYIASAAITGHASNNRTFSVINKGASGTGSTSVAAITSNASTSFTAFDAKALTLSGTAANKVLAAGDVVAFTSVHAASGVADPGGVIRVTVARD